MSIEPDVLNVDPGLKVNNNFDKLSPYTNEVVDTDAVDITPFVKPEIIVVPTSPATKAPQLLL